MPSSQRRWRLETNGDDAAAISVEFHKRGDRYCHEVRRQSTGELLLASLEGGSEAWPPSPALQEISEAIGGDGRRSLLLVGMAGKSHWSLSVHAEEAALVFDVACRCIAAPEWLGSTYAGSQARIESECSMLFADARIKIDAPPATSFPATIRWRYRVTLHSTS